MKPTTTETITARMHRAWDIALKEDESLRAHIATHSLEAVRAIWELGYLRGGIVESLQTARECGRYDVMQ